MCIDHLLLIALVLPWLGFILVQLSAACALLRSIFVLLIPTCLSVVMFQLIDATLSGEQVSFVAYEFFPGVHISFSIEPFGVLFATVAACLWTVNSFYTLSYMSTTKGHRQKGFHSFIMIAMGGAIGVAFSADLLTLFIFYELLTLSTYPLVAYQADTRAIHGARVYVGILLGSSITFFLPAIIFTWSLAGTLDFKVGGILPQGVSMVAVCVLLLLYIFGIGKAALMPIHRWLPSAMVAPTPISALLHAVAVVKVGVFTLLKVMFCVFGIELLSGQITQYMLLTISSVTIISASIIALQSDNLKRRLAYSTISQLAYVVMAAAVLLPISAVGAMLHIVAHATGKITLFLTAGAIYATARKSLVSELQGIGFRMPWTMLAFTIGSLSMIGIPPTAGFLSKWYILLSALSATNWLVVIVIGVSTLLNASYFLPIIYTAFQRPKAQNVQYSEAPWMMRIAVLTPAILTIGLFFYSDTFLKLAEAFWYV